MIDGAVHIILVGHKHFAEVVGLAGLAKDLTLELAHGGVGPARAAAVLVLHGGDGVLLDGGEAECLFVGSFFVLCIGVDSCHGQDGQ